MDEQTSYPGDSLDMLMKAARAGDQTAYRQFLKEAARLIRARLVRKMGANGEVEDIVQESLIAMHEKRHTLDPQRPVGPWMYAIANYKLIDHWRKRGRSPIVLDDEADMAVPADDLAQGDVDTLLARLPAAQAEAIRLTHIEGLTNREAGERLGIGLSAMKLRVHRGMRALKSMVSEGSR